ncbi:aspartate/glutamate racemase family protein [Williamsia sp. 1135]|uniref:aspartate/glutamate racemase family protein n=1 Tax=Williamsia sp. 1135 TaxID=1889262 RepID=UPI000A0FF0CF|nr:aspartate/glutamate racemase family protein [Williamsia sp. 1135]ORM25007.1 Asp/Glu racemase [Williamsia sp. 1135]
MLISVINPNTTVSMTDQIAAAARSVAAPGTEIVGVTPTMGPASIESHYDEALAVPGLLDAIIRSERGDKPADGYLLACFGDPGLDAAREVSSAPVIGIAEAAMHAASLLGRGFSVVTTLGRTIGRAEELVDRYGMSKVCRGIHACEIPVLELESNPDTAAILIEACRSAAEEDGSDAIVLGCAGMADLAQLISEKIGVPVIDGVAAGTLLLQSLVTMRVRPNATGELASPPAKTYTGILSPFGS